MKRKLKIIISSILSITMALSMGGCASKNKIEENIKGRYLSEKYELPKEDVFIQKITELSNGTLGMVGTDASDNIVKYLSEDSGKTWTTSSDIHLPKVDDKEHYVRESFLLSDGRTIINYQISDPFPEDAPESYVHPEPEHKYFIISTDGAISELPLTYSPEKTDEIFDVSYPFNFKVASNGDIFYQSPEGNKIIQLDSNTFEEKNIYEYTSDRIDSYTIVNKSLIIWNYNEIIEFDIESGKEKGNLNKLEDAVIASSNNAYSPLIDSNSKNNLYYYNISGLYSYNFESKVSKKLIDGSLSIFGDSTVNANSLIEKENGDLLVLYDEWDSKGTQLVNYYYSEDASSVPENQLTVYSLYENDSIRQAVTNFNKVNPEIYAKYQVGLTSEDGVTEGDALRTLNTEIMNGKGPDIILLDALPVDSYIEKGLLEDISDIISQYVQDDLLFKGMEESYTVDGKIYQFPTSFKFPILVGDKNAIDKINDLNSINQLSKELSNSSDRRIFDNLYNPRTAVYSLYYLYGSDWLNEDNTINEEALEKFLVDAKEIYELSDEKIKIYEKNNNPDIDDLEEDEGDGDDESFEPDAVTNYYNMINSLSPIAWINSFVMENEPPHLAYGSMDISDFSSLITVLNAGLNIDYKILTRGEENIFIPLETLGINSKGKNKESAKEFIRAILSEKLQKTNKSNGFPVNKKALMSKFDMEEIYGKDFKPKFNEDTGHYIHGAISAQFADGTIKERDLLFPNENDINMLISNLEKLNVAPKLNKVLLMEVANQFDAFVSGSISLDEAVSNVVDNLDLYLSE